MQKSLCDVLSRPPAASDSALLGRDVRRSFYNDHVGFQLNDFAWRHDPQDKWQAEVHVLDFALTPRPKPAWVMSYSDRSAQQGMRQPLGRLMFIPAGQTVRTGASFGSMRSLTCVLAPNVAYSLLDGEACGDEVSMAQVQSIHDSDIHGLMLRISQELANPGFGARILLESLANALAVSIVRKFSSPKARVDMPYSGGLSPWRLRRIRERSYADQPAPSLDDLADLCGMSVRQLTRAFKAETGLTIADFVRQATVDRAHAMLTESDIPIAQIARQLGFSSSTSFCYAFRRATKQRPSDVRAGWTVREPRRERASAARVSKSSHS